MNEPSIRRNSSLADETNPGPERKAFGRHATKRIMLLAACWLAVAGCGGSGPQRYAVSGTITFDGKPLPDGEIIFFPTDDVPQPDAGKIADGKYAVLSLPGKKRVEIRADRPSATKTIATGGETGKVTWIPAREVYIPAQYNTRSKLSIEVLPAGPREFDFQLYSDGR